MQKQSSRQITFEIQLKITLVLTIGKNTKKVYVFKDFNRQTKTFYVYAA